MNDIAIIGAGKVGTVLGRALSRAGYRIIALTCSRISSARKSRKIIGQGTAYADNIQASREADVVILAVQDMQISRISEELSKSDIRWDGKYVFHCSGLLPSNILDLLKNRGAFTASFHPIQSFTCKNQSEQSIEGIFFGIEGGKKSVLLAQEMTKRLGAKHLVLSPEDKSLYHTSCCLASNYIVALLDSASAVLGTIGIKPKQAEEMLYPLVQETLQNVKKFGISASLTGPIVRGDLETVKTHLKALKSLPGHSRIYRNLARQAMETARKTKRLSTETIKALAILLEDK